MSTLTTHPRRGIAIWHCQPCRVIQIEDITDLASLGARKAAHDHTISHRIRARLTPTPQTPDSQPGTRKDTPCSPATRPRSY